MAYVSLVKMWFVCVTHIWVAVCYGISCVSQSKLCVQRLKKIFHVKDDTFNDDENLKLEGRWTSKAHWGQNELNMPTSVDDKRFPKMEKTTRTNNEKKTSKRFQWDEARIPLNKVIFVSKNLWQKPLKRQDKRSKGFSKV